MARAVNTIVGLLRRFWTHLNDPTCEHGQQRTECNDCWVDSQW